MTAQLLKCQKDWTIHKKQLESKIEYAPHEPILDRPLRFPALCVSAVNNSNGKWNIETLFFYKETGELLCK